MYVSTYFANFYTAMGNTEKATLLKQNFLDYMKIFKRFI